jgi:flagellar biosynthesis protein FliQ
MSEISFQALQFTPRLVSVLVLLVLTWLVAKFAQYIVKRANLSQAVARMAFWAVFVIMLPFALNAAGLDTGWLGAMQQVEGLVFSSWPVWMVMSVLMAGVLFVLRTVPKLAGAVNPSGSEIQN